MSAVGWCLMGGVAWSHGGYPLVCAIIGRIRPFRPVVRSTGSPSVSVIVAATNEEPHIEFKLRSSLDAWTRGPVEVICAANGCTDGTVAVARSIGDPRIRVIEVAVRGKSAAQNAALRVARGDVVVFTDANTEVESGAVDRLVRPLGDDRIDVCQGRILMQSDGGGQRAETWYWRYESWVRRQESRLGRTVAASGALMAIRRRDFTPLPVDEMEDIVLPIRALDRGRRSIVVHEAVARERLRGGASAPREAHRRIALQDSRTVLGWIFRRGHRSPLLAIQLVSRKVIRWGALPMGVLALTDLVIEALRGGVLAACVCVPLLVLAMLGLLGARAGGAGSAARHAWEIHFAAFVGMGAMLLGSRLPGWESSRLAGPEMETR